MMLQFNRNTNTFALMLSIFSKSAHGEFLQSSLLVVYLIHWFSGIFVWSHDTNWLERNENKLVKRWERQFQRMNYLLFTKLSPLSDTSKSELSLGSSIKIVVRGYPSCAKSLME
jgi:hypothetical protein